MPTLSTLELVREDIAGQLRLVPALAGATVVTRKTGDIETKINNALAEIGMSLEVYIKRAQIVADSCEGVVVMLAVFGVAAYEDVLITQDPVTGAQKSAYYLIEQAIAALKLMRPDHGAGVLEPDEAGPLEGKVKGRSTALAVSQDFTTIVQIVAANA